MDWCLFVDGQEIITMGNCISKAKARKSNKTNTLVQSGPLQLQDSSVHVQAAAAVASALQIDNLPAVTESDDLIVEDLESEEAASHKTPDIPSAAARDASGKVEERSNTLAQRSMLQLPPAMSALCTKTTGLQYLDSRRRLTRRKTEIDPITMDGQLPIRTLKHSVCSRHSITNVSQLDAAANHSISHNRNISCVTRSMSPRASFTSCDTTSRERLLRERFPSFVNPTSLSIPRIHSPHV